jgi:peptidoglycan/xylan/chitin deacetylase (PgdA/CDA1 family)
MSSSAGGGHTTTPRTALAVALMALATAAPGCRAGRGQRPPSVAGTPPAPQTAAAQRRTTPGQYWQEAKKEVYKSVPELVAQHRDELAKGVRYHKLMRGDETTKQIALTFDDGPHPQFTPKLLAILKQQGVKATFFLVGEMAEKNPGLVRAEAAAGHDLGNHTYHHVDLTKIPSGQVATEMEACGDVLRDILGKPVDLFRPPGGDYNQQVAEVAEELGYTITLWTDDPGDYASPGAEVIATRTLHRAGNGGIILLHDGVQETMDVLPQVIQALKSKGYTFVTIHEMLSQRQERRRTTPRGDRRERM